MSSTTSLYSPETLAATAGGDPLLARELLEIFLRTAPAMATRLLQAARAAQAADLALEAHALRSCLVMIGAEVPALRCRALETAARRGEGPYLPEAGVLQAEVLELVAALEADYARGASPGRA